MTEDSGFRDIKRKPKPGWERWRPPPPKKDLWARLGMRGKTAWDWLDLLIVPVVLGIVAGIITTFQIFYQTWAEDRRQEQLTAQTAQF
jgi:hypothetical protein